MSDMDRDTRTTTRWAVGELEWLEARAVVEGHGRVGTVLRRLVGLAMRAEVAARAGRVVEVAAPAAREGGGSAAVGGTVAGAQPGHGGAPVAASAPRPGAAAARAGDYLREGDRVVNTRTGAESTVAPRTRLEVVVAVHLQGGSRVIAGLQPPAALMRARKAISDGRVSVAGRGPHEQAPGLPVGPGEVWVDGEPVTASWR